MTERKSDGLQSDKQGAAWYAVKDSESYSSVRYRAVLHEAHGEQEVWIARELAHHIAQQIADDHNRARRPGGDWYRRKIEQTGEEPHAIGPLSAGVAIRPRPGEGTDCELGPHHCEFPECSCPRSKPSAREEFTQGDAHPCDISRAVREQTIQDCIAALGERVDSLTTMCDRAGYTREGSDLSQRVSATRDAIEVIRRLNAAVGPGATNG